MSARSPEKTKAIANWWRDSESKIFFYQVLKKTKRLATQVINIGHGKTLDEARDNAMATLKNNWVIDKEYAV